MRWAYTGIVRPTLTYGAHVWATNITTTNKLKLERVNRLGCLIINPVHKSTPTRSLEILYNIKPLHLKLKEIAMENYVRIRIKLKPELRNFRTISKTDKKGHLEKLKTWIQDISTECDSVEHILRSNYGVNMENHTNEERDTIYAYSDGSKIDGDVGFGYSIKHDDIEIGYGLGRLQQHNSVYQAELKGILECAKHLNGLKLLNKDIRIRIDNQAALKSLSKQKKISKLAVKAGLELNYLSKSNNVKLEWTKAHCDNTPEGNIQADLLAKRGTTVETHSEVLPPRNYYKKQIRETIVAEWKKEWLDSKIFRQTRLFMKGPNATITKALMNLSRFWANRLIGFITGHCNLNYHKYKLDATLQSCRLCHNDKEEPFHLFANCPGLLDIRSQIFRSYLLEETVDWQIKDLIKFIKQDTIKNMMTIVE